MIKKALFGVVWPLHVEYHLNIIIILENYKNYKYRHITQLFIRVNSPCPFDVGVCYRLKLYIFITTQKAVITVL